MTEVERLAIEYALTGKKGRELGKAIKRRGKRVILHIEKRRSAVKTG